MQEVIFCDWFENSKDFNEECRVIKDEDKYICHSLKESNSYPYKSEWKDIESESLKEDLIKFATGPDNKFKSYFINPDLEKDFLEIKEKAQKEIKDKINAASAALDEAVKISEQYGIPFHSNIFWVGNTYVPMSFEEKFKGLDESLLEDYSGDYGLSVGWEHSDFCY